MRVPTKGQPCPVQAGALPHTGRPNLSPLGSGPWAAPPTGTWHLCAHMAPPLSLQQRTLGGPPHGHMACMRERSWCAGGRSAAAAWASRISACAVSTWLSRLKPEPTWKPSSLRVPRRLRGERGGREGGQKVRGDGEIECGGAEDGKGRSQPSPQYPLCSPLALIIPSPHSVPTGGRCSGKVRCMRQTTRDAPASPWARSCAAQKRRSRHRGVGW